MSLLLLLFSIVGFTSLLIWASVAFLRSEDRFAGLPLFAAVAIEGLWHIPPAVSMVVAPASLDAVGNTATGSLADLVFSLMWTGGFLLIRRRPITWNDGAGDRVFEERASEVLPRLQVLVIITIAVQILFFPVAAVLDWPVGYAGNDYFVGRGEHAIALGPLWVVFNLLRQLAGPVGCTVILLSRKSVFSRGNALSLATVGLSAIVGLAGGTRAAGLNPVVELVLASLVIRRSTKPVMVLGATAAVVVLMFSASISLMRGQAAFARASLVERVISLFNADTEVAGGDQGLAAGIDRLNKAFYTGVVIQNVDQLGTVGLIPYYAVPFALVPRSLWPEKPLLHSTDGTEYQLFPYLAHYWAHGRYGTSVSVGPAGVGYWMGGALGVVLLGLVSGIVVATLWSGPIGLCRYPFWVIVIFSTMGGDATISGGFGYWIQEVIVRAFCLFWIMCPIMVLVPRMLRTKEQPECLARA